MRRTQPDPVVGLVIDNTTSAVTAGNVPSDFSGIVSLQKGGAVVLGVGAAVTSTDLSFDGTRAVTFKKPESRNGMRPVSTLF